MISHADPVQVAGMIVAALALVFELLQMRCKHGDALWSVPVTIWLIHTIVFYAVFMYDHDGSGVDFILWAAILRLHGYVTIAGLAISRWYVRQCVQWP